MDSIFDTLKEKLKENGYKLTTQRRIIVDVIAENQGGHLSPEEIYDKVKDKYPEIGLATVYRTLQLLEELNIVYKLNFNDGCSRYELNTCSGDHHHHHLICLNCGKVIEVEVDLLENLEEEIEKEGEFKVVDHNVKFFGYCKDCQK
ncbi:Fur family transcriptional regulator [Caldisalinibacter kiritimatiensis]|uniref:Ferric uptake regulation protein FUR n=1 Tax=Caldisalinibacter kiritimatiensis TaxID=1304284 RepID=R1ATJ3_9FIRM|nr:Fur family transcriptional regulator [Caldisalinibacter kiritimatiensis]EOC99946.1 Ferric uptake regulation protein FUR [Caldisalinibacter kiritimatiensis]